MTENRGKIQTRQDKIEAERRHTREATGPSLDPLHAAETDALELGETAFQPQADRHAALLSPPCSDAQRTGIILHLQRTYGNAYVQRLLSSMAVQAKLTVNAPNDIYEQEADRVADTVTGAMSSQAQRQEEEEEPIQMQPVCDRLEQVAGLEGSWPGHAEGMLRLQQTYGNLSVQGVMGQGCPVAHGPIDALGCSFASTSASLPSSARPSAYPSSVDNGQQSRAATSIQRQAEPGAPSSTPQAGPAAEEAEHEVQVLLDPSSVQNRLLNLPLDLTVPDLPFLPTIPSTQETTAPEPKAGSATSRSAPAGPGPPKPKAGTTADVLEAITAVPAVATGLKALQTQATEQVKRDFGRLSTGERIAALSVSAIVAAGALGGILSNPESRQFAFNQLNGRVLPVPGLTGLGVEFNTKGNNLVLGLHLDVGGLLPPSWGFGPSSPAPIGAPPAAVQRQTESTGPQPKLFLNPPDYRCEKEADRVADTVTGAMSSQAQRQEEEEEPIQTQQRAAGSEPRIVAPDLESRINRARAGGQPLPESVRTSFEPHFERDFSNVRVHTDDEADKLSRQLEAKAFTTGKDIFFCDGAYQPDTDAGKGLLAHELTHVVQQKGSQIRRQKETPAGPEEPPKTKKDPKEIAAKVLEAALQTEEGKKAINQLKKGTTKEGAVAVDALTTVLSALFAAGMDLPKAACAIVPKVARIELNKDIELGFQPIYKGKLTGKPKEWGGMVTLTIKRW